MNLERYPIIPKKLRTASFDTGGLLSLTARTLSSAGFNPPLVNLYP